MAANGRHDWIKADLRCMWCGRALGKLFGPARETSVTCAALNQFAAFRPVAPAAPAVRLNGNERFRCDTCRGPAMIEEVEHFSTYDVVVVDDELERPRRGRPPKPWRKARDRRLAELGLAG